jgi:hypothetical protein
LPGRIATPACSSRKCVWCLDINRLRYYNTGVGPHAGSSDCQAVPFLATVPWGEHLHDPPQPMVRGSKEHLDWGPGVARSSGEMSSGISYYSQNYNYAVASDISGYHGGYGTYDGNSRAYNASAMKKPTDAMMSVDLDKRWQALETSVADIRRKMVEQYPVDS